MNDYGDVIAWAILFFLIMLLILAQTAGRVCRG